MSYIARVLLGGNDSDSRDVGNASYGCAAFLDDILRQQVQPHDPGQLDDDTRTSFTQEHTAASLFDTRFRESSLLRRLFATENGHVGLGPICMKPGDAVAIFRGVNQPFILRKVADMYLVVGHGYLEGAQEAYDQHIARGDESMVINLR